MFNDAFSSETIWLTEVDPEARGGGERDEVGNQEWLNRLRRVTPNCRLRQHDPAFGPVFERGEGSSLWDVEGQRWIDLTCGFSACNFGHAYPPLVAAAQRQLVRLTHLTGEPHKLGIELAERLLEELNYAPKTTKVIFNVTGARAVETALKAAQAYRPGKILCLLPGFHGRSAAGAAISQTPQFALSQLIAPGVVRWPSNRYPYCARCPLQLSYPACNTQCIDPLLEQIEDSRDQLSCLVVEPALGPRGYIFPPAESFQRIRQLTQRLGILLIADEVQTGLGRCGGWLLSRQQGWEPDLVVLGKSLGGGITPISAVVGRADVLNSIPAEGESETFAGNPLACAVALAVLELLADGSLVRHGKLLGESLRATLRNGFMQSGLAAMLTVEGQAASCVVEFNGSAGGAPPTSLQEQSRWARRFAQFCLEQRLRVHLSGPERTRVVMLPALTLQADELEMTISGLQSAILQLSGLLKTEHDASTGNPGRD